jgi:Zn-dependent M28 family amino/carboxypeptidase
VFVGYGVNAPERGWNDYEGIDMRGKTAVILVNDPDYDSPDLEGPFNGKAMTFYGRWTYKYEEAARQGASGAIIIHDTAPASYGWNVVESSWSGAAGLCPARAERAAADRGQRLGAEGRRSADPRGRRAGPRRSRPGRRRRASRRCRWG